MISSERIEILATSYIERVMEGESNSARDILENLTEQENEMVWDKIGEILNLD